MKHLVTNPPPSHPQPLMTVAQFVIVDETDIFLYFMSQFTDQSLYPVSSGMIKALDSHNHFTCLFPSSLLTLQR